MPSDVRKRIEEVSASSVILLTCTKCHGTGKLAVTNPKWLRDRRLKAGVGLREMARRIGCSAPYVSDVERGRRNCPKEWNLYYGRLRAAREAADKEGK